MVFRRGAFVIVMVIIPLLLFLTLTPAVKSATDYGAELQITFVDEGTNWVVLARQGQQVTQTFTVTVFCQVPATMRLNVYIGGELEFSTRQDIQFKFVKEIKTTKTADVRVICQLEYGEVLKELTWEGTCVAKPAPIPKGVSDYFTPSQVKSMIENLNMEWVFKALLFGAIGAGVAIITRYVFMLLQPWTGLHLSFIVVLIFGYYFVDKVNWIYYFIISLVIDFLTYYFIKSADVINVLEPEVGEQNINLVGLPVYNNHLGTCVALQNSMEAIRRVFFGNHVVLKLNGPLKSSWTLNHSSNVTIANSAKLEELQEEAAESAGQVMPKPVKRKGWKRFFTVDLAASHQYPSWELVHKANVHESMSKKIEELTRENSMLKALMEANSVKKAQEIATDFVTKLYQVVFEKKEEQKQEKKEEAGGEGGG